jgi:triphosphatase
MMQARDSSMVSDPPLPVDEAGPKGPAQAGSAGAEPHGIPREIEVKFEASPATLTMLAGAPLFDGARWKGQSLRSVYFDTAEGDLRAAGTVLRLRQQGRTRLLTAKWAGHGGDSFARGEVEVRVRSDVPDLAQLGAGAATALAELIGDEPLLPQLETVVRRRSTVLSRDGSLVEVALDRGHIHAAGHRAPLCEVELELKQGEAQAVFDLATELLDVAPLRLGILAKAQKGFMLLDGRDPEPVKAAEIVLDDNATIDDAIAAVIGSALTQFVANWPCLEETDRPESIHQMRVGLRRLRAGLGLFRAMLETDRFDAFRDKAKAIATTLGAARDWDVFDDHVRAGPLAQFPDEEGLTALLDAARVRRDDAYRDARALIAAPDTNRFVLELRSLAAGRGWREGMEAPGDARFALPAGDFAIRALNRLHKKALKRGRHLDRLGHEEKHALRIALKKLRYAAEFFDSLFGRSTLKKRYRRDIAELQESLGGYNDLATAHRLLAELSAADAGLDRAAGIVLGWSGRGMLAAEQHLAKQWHAFRDLDRFWR